MTKTTVQPSLFPNKTLRPTTDPEDAYLCAWLRSRLDPVTRTLRDDSALTVTPHDQRQIARLLRVARARGLSIFNSSARTTDGKAA